MRLGVSGGPIFDTLGLEFRLGAAIVEADTLLARRSEACLFEVLVGGGVRMKLLDSVYSAFVPVLVLSFVGVREVGTEGGPGEEDSCLEGSTGGRTRCWFAGKCWTWEASWLSMRLFDDDVFPFMAVLFTLIGLLGVCS